MKKLRRDESGQSTVEYILLLSVLASLAFAASVGIKKMGWTAKLMAPLKEQFARTYRYGHPEALGYDDGGPKNHPRAAEGGDNNFRIFISPERI